MEKLEATYRIVTPMFLGGAEHEATSIRPPSVKGVLRFWWRALNWGRFRKGTADDTAALINLHKEENLLFGNAAEEENGEQVGGQGCFLMTIKHESLVTIGKNTVHQDFAAQDAARYLGYGLMVPFKTTNRDTNITKLAGQLERNCINENQLFTITLLFKNKIDNSIVQAIKTMGLIGGLGSRTRRGMGSVALETLKSISGRDEKEIWKKPADIKQYKTEVKSLFMGTYATAGIDEPPYSAFSRNARIDCLVTGNSTYSVLNQLGKAMMMYRSWGRGEIVLGIPSEKNFKNDHDWDKGLLTITKPDFHPERVMFGLPHDYGKKNSQKVKAEKHERRASPVLFHIHRFDDENFIGVSTYLPSHFLPDDEKIKAGLKDVTAKIDYTVITDFIDGKDRKSPNIVTNRFPKKQGIMP